MEALSSFSERKTGNRIWIKYFSAQVEKELIWVWEGFGVYKSEK